jgi:hypothetical protein
MLSTKPSPFMLKLIAVLMLLTVFRAQTILFIPQIEMFDGIAPNGWLGPWLSDFIIGLFVPVMVFVILKLKGLRSWGLLVLYNAVGAFDYSQGLMTQWVSPMPQEMASEIMVYAGIGFFMTCQLLALGLLFRTDVLRHFTTSAQMTP